MSTTWPMETVFAVGRIYADVTLDKYHLATYPDEAVEVARQKAGRVVINEAHALAVEVHPEDIREVGRQSDQPFKIKVRFGWAPTTKEVELIDHGENDGRILEVQDPQRPLLIPRPAPPLYLQEADGPHPIAPVMDHLQFELSGWREKERRWVMEARS